MTSTMRAVSLACESIYSRSPVVNPVKEPQRWWRDVCTISVSTAHDYLQTWFSLFPSRKTVAPGWLICQLWCQNTIISRLRFPVNFSSSLARNQPPFWICRRWNLNWFNHNTIPWLNENVLNMNNRMKINSKPRRDVTAHFKTRTHFYDADGGGAPTWLREWLR